MNTPIANIVFFILSIACQTISLGLLFLLCQYFECSNTLIIFFVPICAFFISLFLNLPYGWVTFNTAILPSIILYEGFGLSSLLLVTLMIITTLLYLPTLWTRVPYYPTSHETYQAISDLIPNLKSLKFMDIGCGNSSLLIYLSRKHPEVLYYGTEISPLAYFISKIRTFSKKNIFIEYKSFWSLNFKEYDIVYCFLSPTPMQKLWIKIENEMKKDSIFISNSFEVPAMPAKTIQINDKRKCRILLYNIK